MNKYCLRPTTPDDVLPLRRFLARVFSVEESVPWLDPAMLTWKYWSPRGDWSEPRSYVLDRKGEIVAHAGLWPFTYQSRNVDVRGIQMLDWAADPEAPGAGVAIVQKFNSMFDFIYSIGGSEATRKVLPAFGFKEYTRQWRAVRPLHPLRHALTHPQRNWKLPARFVRNLAWNLRKTGDNISGWSAAECTADKIGPSAHDTCLTFSPRPPAFFRYLQGCPSVEFRLYEIGHEGREQGHFLLSMVRGQVRIAGIWLTVVTPEAWRAAYGLAYRAAVALPGACELVSSGSIAGSHRAEAERTGFRTWDGPPVYLLDKKKKAELCPEFQFQFSDDDRAFLDSGTADYWS